jgi:Spy/CpxP family protein refolding chaperone
MKRNQWTAIALAALLFICGAAIGALADHYYTATAVSAKTGAEGFRERYISEMRQKVNLTPAQITQLEQILDETKAKVKTVRDLYHPAMLKIREDQIARVKGILTAQQVPAYEQLVAERERRAKEQEEHDRQEEQKRAAAHRNQPAP